MVSIKRINNMYLFWKYFFQGFGHYCNTRSLGRKTNLHSHNDRFIYDFQAVSSDFTKVYNKITETNK